VRQKTFALAVLLIVTSSGVGFGQAADPSRYLMPPKDVVEAFDAPPLPQAILSPTKAVMALTLRRNYPTIAELSQPILRLAGRASIPGTTAPSGRARSMPSA
jgi:hypothetical protein